MWLGLLMLIPGVLLSYLLFSRLPAYLRITYTLLLSVSLANAITFILSSVRAFSADALIITVLLSIPLLGLILYRNRTRLAAHPAEIRATIGIGAFALIGTAWRWYFRNSANSWGDGFASRVSAVLNQPTAQSGGSVGEIPDLNFYTGVVADYAPYQTPRLLYSALKELGAYDQYLFTFFAVFVLASLAYTCIMLYSKRADLAYLGSFIIALGPIEIWHTTFTITGGDLSYAALMVLFIAMRERTRAYAVLAGIVSFVMAITYHTGSIVLLIASLGFAATILLRTVLARANHKSSAKTLLSRSDLITCIVIALISASILFTFHATTTARHVTEPTLIAYDSLLEIGEQSEPDGAPQSDRVISTPRPTYPYESEATFAGLSAITWQNIVLLLIGSTFFVHILTHRRTDHDLDTFYAIVPAALVGLAFVAVNMEQRSFTYLAFFAFTALRVPRSISRFVIVIIVAFFVLTGYVVASERVAFYTNAPGELDAARWVANSLNGTVISDSRFSSLLIAETYYDVDGFSDISPHMYTVFYSAEPTDPARSLCELNASYFVSTDRMREGHILMANFPSMPSTNIETMRAVYPIVYDNGDAIVFDVSSSCVIANAAGSEGSYHG